MRCILASISYEADVFISSRWYSIITGSTWWDQSDTWLSCRGDYWHYKPADGKYPSYTWHHNASDGNYPSCIWGSPLMPHIGQSMTALSHGHTFHVTGPLCVESTAYRCRESVICIVSTHLPLENNFMIWKCLPFSVSETRRRSFGVILIQRATICCGHARSGRSKFDAYINHIYGMLLTDETFTHDTQT